ncbi:MAG: tetratricopeptide repeat protein, partial [Sphingobacteriales bacterium]
IKGLYFDALSDFNRSIELDSLDKLGFNNRGLCLYYLRRYDEAIIDFKKALSVKMDDSFYENFDTDAYTYNNVGNVYFDLENLPEACKNWRTAIQNGYQYKKEWKAMYHIDDPVELVSKYCK